jgi:hypothetical protein
VIFWHIWSHVTVNGVEFVDHRAEVPDTDFSLVRKLTANPRITPAGMNGRPPWPILKPGNGRTDDPALAALRREAKNLAIEKKRRPGAPPPRERNPEEQEWERERGTVLAAANNAGVAPPPPTPKKAPDVPVKSRRGIPTVKEKSRGRHHDANRSARGNPGRPRRT